MVRGREGGGGMAGRNETRELRARLRAEEERGRVSKTVEGEEREGGERQREEK